MWYNIHVIQEYPKKITAKFSYAFTAKHTGLHTISILATCKSGKQIDRKGGEDLRVEIDGTTFREVPEFARKQVNNIASSWNGTNLQGLPKTLVFILDLDIGKHELTFTPHLGAEIISEPVVEPVTNHRDIVFAPNIQAEEGDRRSWYAVILVDLPLAHFTLEATALWRKQDSDDIKIVIDGQMQENTISAWRRTWYWLGSFFKKPERQKHTFSENLKEGVHSIELWADRQPTLHLIELDLGERPRVPTVDDPRWIGDFEKDPAEILLARLILGEAENQSREAKIWVGGSVLNRVGGAAWRDTVKKVILQPGQYDPFKDTDRRFPVIINPLDSGQPGTANAWRESYEIAQSLINGEIKNPTEATHFHGSTITRDWFIEHVVPNGRFLRQIDDTYFYWSPN